MNLCELLAQIDNSSVQDLETLTTHLSEDTNECNKVESSAHSEALDMPGDSQELLALLDDMLPCDTPRLDEREQISVADVSVYPQLPAISSMPLLQSPSLLAPDPTLSYVVTVFDQAHIRLASCVKRLQAKNRILELKTAQ